jgi:hypothetical protein
MIRNNREFEQETKPGPATEQAAFEQKWDQALAQFDPISLDQSAKAHLMRRTDTKYVFPTHLLPAILNKLQSSYQVLEMEDVRLQHYQTVYFDTPDFQLYQQHHNGQRDRFKLRVRSYLNSQLNYLEVKRKDNHDVTRKTRMETSSPVDSRAPEIHAFLESAFPLSDMPLVPKITNQFHRISLVSRGDAERLTLDLNLRFSSPSGNFSIPGIVIAEVKQPHFSVHSAFIQEMRQSGFRPTRFSKYCVGVALAYPHLKRNAFKPLLLNLEKLVLGGTY